MKQREKLERLLFVSRVKEHGDEAKARAIIERDFPRESMERAGLVGFTASFGGGYCVFEYGFEGPFDPVFEKLDADPKFQEYLRRLGEYVEPVPRVKPGETADDPIAADIFIWRKESGILAREPARPRTTRRTMGT